jgi:microcystin-dependent protein
MATLVIIASISFAVICIISLIIVISIITSKNKTKTTAISKMVKSTPTDPSSYSSMVLSNQNGDLSSSTQFPRGMIVIWSGDLTQIPDGWALCDGKGTPDLRGKFVLGVNPYNNSNGSVIHDTSSTGGSETSTLTINQIPSHTHTYKQWVNPPEGPNTNTVMAYPNGSSFYIDSAKIYTTNSTGGGDSHSIMPPFYSLAYIMKT